MTKVNSKSRIALVAAIKRSKILDSVGAADPHYFIYPSRFGVFKAALENIKFTKHEVLADMKLWGDSTGAKNQFQFVTIHKNINVLNFAITAADKLFDILAPTIISDILFNCAKQYDPNDPIGVQLIRQLTYDVDTKNHIFEPKVRVAWLAPGVGPATVAKTTEYRTI